MAYLGNPGGTGQVLTVSGGAPVWNGGTLRNYDANHVAAWRLDSTDGNTFLASVGGVDITGGGGAFATVQGGGIFPRSLNRAATYSQTTGDAGFNTLNALSLSGTTSFTVEFYYYVNQSSMYSGIACHLIDIISPSGIADNHLAIKGNFPAGNFRTFFRTNSGDVEMFVGVGAGYTQTAPNTAHHVMVVWSVNSFVRLFIDGVQVGSSGAASRSATVLSTLTVYMTAGLYMADLRVSNVARDASYAQTATRLLMTM